MSSHDPSPFPAREPLRNTPVPDPHRWSAARIAGIYLIAGLLWIGLSDISLARSGGLTTDGLRVAVSKGSLFVLLSTGLVFWLCRREYRNTAQSMKLLKAVVEGTNDAVFVKDRAGKYLLVNTAGAQIMGKPVTEVLGRDDSEVFDAVEGARLMANDRQIMAGGRVVTLQETLTSAGMSQTYQATKAPYVDASGAVAGLIGISRNVTDRVQVEAVLRETDARLREAQRIARLGSWSWEPPTNSVWWSDAEFELFGVDPSAVKPSFDTFLSLLHPDDRAVAVARVEAMLAGANEFANDLRVIRGDGSCMWIHSQARATRDSDGKLVRVEGTDQDITAPRRAREAAEESERRLQAAIEVAELGIIVIDIDQQTVSHSARACEQFGYPPGTNMSRNELRSRFHPSDAEQLNELIKASFDPTGPGSFALEHRIIRPDGTTRWLNVRQQVSFVNGQPQRAVVVTADVTARRQAEARLREQEMLVLEAAELAKVGGWGFDPITLESDWTPQLANIYGLAADTAPAIQEVVRLYVPEHRTTLERALADAMENGSPHDLELQLVSADGVTKWVRAICRPIVEGDRVVRVRGSLQDITDRKNAEAELQAGERRLRLALEAAGAIAFVWNVPDDSVTRYFSREPALPANSERVGTLNEVRAHIHPEDLPHFDSRLAACLACGSDYRNAYRVVRPDGTTANLEEYGYLDRAADGSPSRLTGMSIDVTSRVAASESLRMSDERLRVALKGARGGVWDWDLASGMAWWSPEMFDLIGAKLGDDTGPAFALSLIHEDDRQRVRDAIDAAITGRTDYHCEFRVQGGTRWLSSHARISMDATGKPIRLVGISWDITDRVGADEALRLSESRYRQLVDMLPTAIFVHADNSILFGNPAFVRLMGAANSSELLGRSPYDLFQSTVPDALRPMQHNETALARESMGLEMLGVRCDGRSVPLHVVAAPVEGYGSNATLVALSDLTERERSAAMLRSVLDSVDDAILTVDASGTVTSVNQSTERLFDYIESELIGINIHVLVPDLNGERHDRRVVDYMRTKSTRSMGVGRDVEGRRKDGTCFPAELVITEFLRDGHREFTWVLRDITARRQLEEQFRQAQKMEAVGRLAGGVAHDFNNLLTVINGYSELILTGLPVADPMQGPLTAIHDAGDRAARLTKQLLALSRKSMVEPRLVDLNELVAESANLFRRLIGEDIALLVLADPKPVRVVLDPGQLEQVLMNLVVNARDAMPAGGRLTIETRAVVIADSETGALTELSPGRYAALRVTDTGCGINADFQDKIFEPFFTTKGVGKGTGLGLAVVHGVVQQSGGSITVESSEGTGATFRILLPAADEAANEAVATESHASLQGRETVLVVEDEEAVRTLVRFTLEEQGYHVLTASAGLDALDLIRLYPSQVDLLVTDMIMPGISGRELAEEARKARPGLRVVYMSGYTDDALSRYGLQGTSDQFIQKPFTPLGLVRKIRTVLDQA